MKSLFITPSRCIGCLNCELACASHCWSEYFPAPSKINLTFFKDGGQVPIACFQCDSAPCLAVCRTGALYKNEAGVVEMKAERCIGCRMCVMACPFGNIVYSPAGQRAVKCDQCQGQPRCVAVCPSRAIEYVLDEETVKDRRQTFAAGLKTALKTLD